jgi:hypothetical protein
MKQSLMFASFVDELTKIAASHGAMNIPKARSGIRPMSVDTLLRKEKDGTLWKQADSQGNPQNVRGDSSDDPGAAQLPKRPGEVPTRTVDNIAVGQKLGYIYGDVPPIPTGESPFAYQEAKKPRRKGDVPSKDDSNVVDRYDQRDNATTVTGLGQQSTGIGAFNSPAEHT